MLGGLLDTHLLRVLQEYVYKALHFVCDDHFDVLFGLTRQAGEYLGTRTYGDEHGVDRPKSLLLSRFAELCLQPVCERESLFLRSERSQLAY